MAGMPKTTRLQQTNIATMNQIHLQKCFPNEGGCCLACTASDVSTDKEGVVHGCGIVRSSYADVSETIGVVHWLTEVEFASVACSAGGGGSDMAYAPEGLHNAIASTSENLD